MNPIKLHYLLFIIGTICLGLLSHQFILIPLFIGDLLYGTITYYIFRFILIKKDLKLCILFSFLFCFSIEFL
ncbi:MAG: DUF2809 domain-containing protein [Bacteroidetes bacterium]|nr:DUF2809 domain-containing protein [Bacteroidota bacterium]